jgi:hypothetical protein
MKKFLVTGVLALTAAALSPQPAPAWWKVNFGVGFNFNFGLCSDNNGFFFGWYNGPAPCHSGHFPSFGHSPDYYGAGCSNGFGGDYAYQGHYDRAPATAVRNGNGSAPAANTQAWQYSPYNYGYYPMSYYPGHWYGQ